MEKIERITFGAQMPDIQCPFCRKVLHQLFYSSDTAQVWTPRYERCGCPGSKAHEEQERQEKEQREAEDRDWKHKCTVERLLRDSGIKGRYLDKSLDNYLRPPGDERAFKSALKYVSKFSDMRRDGMGLYLTGTKGVGKTHLAYGIARALIEQEHRVICKPSVTMLADIKATYANTPGEPSEYELLRKYLDADLLVIDDLGKEQITDWSLTELFTVINMRYEDQRPIVITTNYTDDGLIGRLARTGDRITADSLVSRLHEMCFSLEVVGEDYRGR